MYGKFYSKFYFVISKCMKYSLFSLGYENHIFQKDGGSWFLKFWVISGDIAAISWRLAGFSSSMVVDGCLYTSAFR